jgi:hypothetical protein
MKNNVCVVQYRSLQLGFNMHIVPGTYDVYTLAGYSLGLTYGELLLIYKQFLTPHISSTRLARKAKALLLLYHQGILRLHCNDYLTILDHCIRTGSCMNFGRFLDELCHRIRERLHPHLQRYPYRDSFLPSSGYV